jgi:hypothetical protein
MLKVILTHWDLARLAKDHPQIYEQLRLASPDLKPLEEAEKGYQDFEAFINDAADMPDEVLEVAKFKSVKPLKFDFSGQISTFAIRDALATQQVHLPGNELLRVSEARVLEDCCTDELNDQLRAGWRIIAVCPRATRRPDYILGRALPT